MEYGGTTDITLILWEQILKETTPELLKVNILEILSKKNSDILWLKFPLEPLIMNYLSKLMTL